MKLFDIKDIIIEEFLFQEINGLTGRIIDDSYIILKGTKNAYIGRGELTIDGRSFIYISKILNENDKFEKGD